MSTATPTGLGSNAFVVAPGLKTFRNDGTIRYSWKAVWAPTFAYAAIVGAYPTMEMAALKARLLTEANEPFPEARRM